MKSIISISIGLAPDGEPPRAIRIRNGSGCNLWIGDLCITARSSAEFLELAAVAAAAAVIQEESDRLRTMPHVYRVSSALDGITPPALGWTCGLCDQRRDSEIHVGEALK